MEKYFRDYNEHNSMGIMADLKLGLWDVRILGSNPGSTTFYISDCQQIIYLYQIKSPHLQNNYVTSIHHVCFICLFVISLKCQLYENRNHVFFKIEFPVPRTGLGHAVDASYLVFKCINGNTLYFY